MVHFELTDIEENDAKQWIKEHSEVCPHSYKNNNIPTLGDHYYYKFIPNGLGRSVSVGCIYCKVEKDVTDVSNW